VGEFEKGIELTRRPSPDLRALQAGDVFQSQGLPRSGPATRAWTAAAKGASSSMAWRLKRMISEPLCTRASSKASTASQPALPSATMRDGRIALLEGPLVGLQAAR